MFLEILEFVKKKGQRQSFHRYNFIFSSHLFLGIKEQSIVEFVFIIED